MEDGGSIAVTFPLHDHSHQRTPLSTEKVTVKKAPPQPHFSSALNAQIRNDGGILPIIQLRKLMWPCHFCPAVHGVHPQAFGVNADVVSRPGPTHPSLQWSNAPSNADSCGYQRHQSDDSAYNRPSSSFTDPQPSLRDRQCCHQAWNNSHATSGIKRKRCGSANRMGLALQSNTYNSPADMQNSGQPREHNPGSFLNHTQPPSVNSSWETSLRWQDGQVNDQYYQGQLNLHQNFDRQMPQPRDTRSKQPSQYATFDAMNRDSQHSSFPSHGNQPIQASTLGSLQFAQSQFSASGPYLKEVPDLEWTQAISRQYGASPDGGTDFKPSQLPMTPPSTALGPASEDLDLFDPNTVELPPWDFPDLSSYSQQEGGQFDNQIDFGCAEETKNQLPNTTNPQQEIVSGNDMFGSWDEISTASHGLPDVNPGSYEYPPLEDTAGWGLNGSNKAPDQVYGVRQNADPNHPAWPMNTVERMPDTSKQDLWDLPQTHDTSRSDTYSSEQPSLPNSSKRYCHDRALGYRDEQKDQLLIQWKQEGMSYKEIKIRGQFEEAESTLRGRYRTLTKPKEARVRKPEWQEQDIHNLLLAVDHFTQANQHGQPRTRQRYSPYPPRRQPHRQQDAGKVPWKQVAEYMEELGSYRFGNATVKKKYLQVIGGGGL